MKSSKQLQGSIHLSFTQFTYLPTILPPTHLPFVHSSTHLLIHPFIYPVLHSPIHSFVIPPSILHLFAFIYPSTPLPVHQSTYISIHLLSICCNNYKLGYPDPKGLSQLWLDIGIMQALKTLIPSPAPDSDLFGGFFFKFPGDSNGQPVMRTL